MAEPTSAIGDLLTRELRHRRMSERAFALYAGVSPNAVNAWRRGMRIPDPAYCEKIAEALHLAVEDVLRAAGHLPPLEEGAEEPALPAWLTSLLSELDEAELRVVEHSVRGLLELREARATYDAQPPAPEEPPGEPPAPPTAPPHSPRT